MTREQVVLLSPRMLAAMQSEAEQKSRTLSHCVEQAWKLARSQLAGICGPVPLPQDEGIGPFMYDDLPYENPRAEAIYASRFADATTRSIRLAFSDDIYEDMSFEADRLARPLSWVVERAWCLASAEDAGDTLELPRFD
ncbi:MAG: hypothetical protein ABI867_40990 [Kofleriaceae bacterium]